MKKNIFFIIKGEKKRKKGKNILVREISQTERAKHSNQQIGDELKGKTLLRQESFPNMFQISLAESHPHFFFAEAISTVSVL